MPSANRMTTPVAIEAGDRGSVRASSATTPSASRRSSRTPTRRRTSSACPDDRCQCAHWGVVTEGQLTFRWPDHEETYVAGDAYYAPPGHLPLVTAGTSIVEFSPTADLEATMAVVEKNLPLRERRHDRGDARRTGRRRHTAVANLIRFLETGAAPDGLFAPDVFADLSLPHWRIQAGTAEEILADPVRQPSLPGAGARRARRADRPRVHRRVRGALGPRRPALVLPRDDPRRRRGRPDRRDVACTAPATGTRPGSASTLRRCG